MAPSLIVKVPVCSLAFQPVKSLPLKSGIQPSCAQAAETIRSSKAVRVIRMQYSVARVLVWSVMFCPLRAAAPEVLSGAAIALPCGAARVLIVGGQIDNDRLRELDTGALRSLPEVSIDFHALTR